MTNVVSINKKIDKLDYKSILSCSKPVDEGAQACTIPIGIRWSDNEETNAYLKCFPVAFPQSLVNEVTGFIVGKGCGLPLPNKMGLMRLPDQFSTDNSFLKWGVVVSELPGSSLKSIWKGLGESDQAVISLLDNLFAWSSVENMLAFDDWMANKDRNIGNIIIRSPNDYSLIDHSDMPVRQGWSPADLDPSVQVDSKLAKIYNYPQVVDEGDKEKLKHMAATHAMVYNNVKEDLFYWWKESLCLAGGYGFFEQRFEYLKHFFEERSKQADKRLEQNPTLLKAS